MHEYDSVDAKMLAASLDVPEKEVIEMQKRLGSPDVSLDAPIGDSSTQAFRDFIADDRDAIDQLLADRQVKEIFSRHLEEFKVQLKGRDSEFFFERMLSEHPLTLQELGDRYGITRERARQIEARILKKLKKFVEDKRTLDIS